MKQFAFIFAALFNSMLALCQTDLNVLTGSSGNIQTNIDALHSGRVSFSITEYGAVDGSDSTAAIQMAVDSASAMKRNVFIPLGRFKVSTAISVPSGILISGTGRDSIIEVSSGSIAAFAVVGANYSTLENFSISGYSNNTASASSAGSGVYVAGGSSGTRLRNLNISKFNVGAYITGSALNTELIGCDFKQNARAGIDTASADWVSAIGCRIDGDRTGIGNGALGQLGIWFQAGSTHCSAIGNQISNLDDEGINLKCTYFTVAGNILNTVGNGIICETDASDTGASDNGSYGAITGNNVTTVDGVGIYAGNTIGVNDSAVHHVSITGNTVKGAQYGITLAGLNSSGASARPYACSVSANIVEGTTVGGGISINADDCDVSGNIIRTPFTDGVQVYRAHNLNLGNNHISGARGNGIYLFTEGTNNVVGNNTVLNCGTALANSDGIRIGSQTYAKVSGNLVNGSSLRYGISDESTSSFSQFVGNRNVGTFVITAFNFAGTSGTRVNFDSTTFSVNDSVNRVGVNTQSPGTTAGGQSAAIDIVGRNLKWGGDTDTTRTDDVAKVARWMVPAYDTTPATDVLAIKVDAGSGNNDISYGGGSSVGYAATRHIFYTGANPTTTTGTEALRIDSSQNVGIGTLTAAAAKLEVAGNILVSYGSSFTSKNSVGSARTLMSYSDASGVLIGSGSTSTDGIVLRAGGSSAGVTIGSVGVTTPVTMQRLDTATTGSNLFDSNQLKFNCSIWNGTAATSYYMRLVGVATATNGPVYNLSIKDDSGNNVAVFDNSLNTTFGGNAIIGTVGKGLKIKEGSNATMGISAAMVAGTVIVTNTAVTATSRIFLTSQSLGTISRPAAVSVTAKSAGNSFTIMSSDPTDTSVVAWEIIEPAP